MNSTNSQALAEDELNAVLLKRVGEGDRESFTVLYKRFYTHLTRFAYRYLQSPEVIEEVVNDTLLTVWQKANSFRGESRVSTWIMGIIARKCWQAGKKNKPRAEESSDFNELVASEQLLESFTTQRTIGWGVQQLTADHRACIELAYGYGYTCEEISEIMECPVNTIKTRLHHARKILRKVLKADDNETDCQSKTGGLNEPG